LVKSVVASIVASVSAAAEENQNDDDDQTTAIHVKEPPMLFNSFYDREEQLTQN